MKPRKINLFIGILLIVLAAASCSKTSQPTPPTPTVTLAITSFTPASGKAGTEVVVMGTGFGSDINSLAISFAGTASVKPKAVSLTQLTVIVPATAKTGKISLTLNNGTPVYSAETFTVIEDPNTYTVKTIGINRIRYALGQNNKLVQAELLGGGNRIILKAGNDHAMEFVNARNVVPVVEQYLDAFPHAFYSNVNAAIDNGNPPDTTGVVLKLKGLNKTTIGYNQLNLVLCDDKKLSADYNLVMLAETEPLLTRSLYNDAFFRQVFTGNITVSYTEVAPPLSASSYIIRDATINGATIVYNANYQVTRLDASYAPYYFGAIFKLDPTGTISVGGQIKTELVNAEKGTISFPSPHGPTFSNIKTGGFGQIVEPADSIDKVFIRMTGFNPSICGFNQLRLFLTRDGLTGSGAIGYANEPPTSQLTLPFIQQTFNTNNLNCIQLVSR